MTVFPLIYLAAIRFPLISPKWRRNLLIHCLTVCLISVVHTSLIVVYRAALFPLLGLGGESYGYLPVRYPMEFSHLFIYYWVTLSFIYLIHEIRFAREREVQQAKLESSLSEAQLQNLRLQLEPHFLFNALNAISTAVYENPRVADEMIGRLAELLRHLLKDDRSQLVTLEREIEVLQLYTRIMEARLEDRFSIEFEIGGEAKDALVPQLLLQPLVENAVRHGMDSGFRVRVEIGARCESGWMLLSVRDHGPGIDQSNPLPFGIGLRNTTDRLQRIYGEEQSFQIENAEGGGTNVRIRFPLQLAPANGAVLQPRSAELMVR